MGHFQDHTKSFPRSRLTSHWAPTMCCPAVSGPIGVDGDSVLPPGPRAKQLDEFLVLLWDAMYGAG
jgi:hypothetical protein